MSSFYFRGARAPQPALVISDARAPQPALASSDARAPQPTLVISDARAPQPTLVISDARAPQPALVISDARAPQAAVASAIEAGDGRGPRVAPDCRPDWATRIILELLRAGETVRFVARGNSMWPTIPSRSKIEVRPSEAADLRVGQIAAFERQGRVVVHRVRAVNADSIEFAGDASRQGDGSVAREAVLGRAHVLRRRPLSLQLPKPRHLRILMRALSRRFAIQ